jgi:hypothetical protein
MTRKVLRVALAQGRYDVAAHALVYGLIKAKVKESPNGTKRSTRGQSKRP